MWGPTVFFLYLVCIQDTLSSRASKGILHTSTLYTRYPIVARALGLAAARAKESCSCEYFSSVLSYLVSSELWARAYCIWEKSVGLCKCLSHVLNGCPVLYLTIAYKSFAYHLLCLNDYFTVLTI